MLVSTRNKRPPSPGLRIFINVHSLSLSPSIFINVHSLSLSHILCLSLPDFTECELVECEKKGENKGQLERARGRGRGIYIYILECRELSLSGVRGRY